MKKQQNDLFSSATPVNLSLTCYNCEYCDVDQAPKRSADDIDLIFCSVHVGRFGFRHAQNCAHFERTADLITEKQKDEDGREFTRRFFINADGIKEELSERLKPIHPGLIDAAKAQMK